MRRRLGILFVATVVLVSLGSTAILIWQTETGNISMRSVRYGIGAIMIVVGVELHRAANVRQRRIPGTEFRGAERQPDAKDVERWMGRALIGAAMIAAAYLFG